MQPSTENWRLVVNYVNYRGEPAGLALCQKKEQPQAKESVAEMPQGRCQHTKMRLTMTSLYHAIKNISPYRVKLLVDLRLKYSPNQQKKSTIRNYLQSSTNYVTENLST